MDSLLKPTRFECEHTSPAAGESWSHWKKTFSNFIKAIKKKTPAEGEEVDCLDLLVNYVSPTIYTYIADCDTYEKAIETLDSLFIKEVNQIYARHILATRKQEDEDLDSFLQKLKTLSKSCKFKSVTAEVYAQEAVRDAFISGMKSQQIRTRLLENNTLTLDEAFSQARALESAIEHSIQ